MLFKLAEFNKTRKDTLMIFSIIFNIKYITKLTMYVLCKDYRNEPRGPKKDDYGRSQGYNFYFK